MGHNKVNNDELHIHHLRHYTVCLKRGSLDFMCKEVDEPHNHHEESTYRVTQDNRYFENRNYLLTTERVEVKGKDLRRV